MICGRSESNYRKTLLQILAFRDAVCIQRFAGRAFKSIDAETVSDLLMSSDRLRRFSSISITHRHNVGRKPLPGLTTSSQMEPGALDRLCHSINQMDKHPERVALEATNGVLDADRPWTSQDLAGPS